MFFCVVGDPQLAAAIKRDHPVVEAAPGLSVQMLMGKLLRQRRGGAIDQAQVIIAGDIDAAQRLAFALLKMRTFERQVLLLTAEAPTGEVAEACLHVQPATETDDTLIAVYAALGMTAPVEYPKAVGADNNVVPFPSRGVAPPEPEPAAPTAQEPPRPPAPAEPEPHTPAEPEPERAEPEPAAPPEPEPERAEPEPAAPPEPEPERAEPEPAAPPEPEPERAEPEPDTPAEPEPAAPTAQEPPRPPAPAEPPEPEPPRPPEPEPAPPALPAAGWYQDPQIPSQYRYWDGEAWTSHTHKPAPAPPEPEPPRPPEPEPAAAAEQEPHTPTEPEPPAPAEQEPASDPEGATTYERAVTRAREAPAQQVLTPPGTAPRRRGEQERMAGNVLAITAAKGGVGKSSLTLWIAERMTSLGLKVCVVDANIAQPDLLEMTGNWKPEYLGLANLTKPAGQLITFEELDNSLIAIENLGDILPGPPDAVRTFQEPSLRAAASAIGELRHRYQWIVVDTPVASGFERAMDMLVKPHADQILVVVTRYKPTALDTIRWMAKATAPLDEGGFEMDVSKFVGVINEPQRSDQNLSRKKLVSYFDQSLPFEAALPYMEATTSAVNQHKWQCPPAAQEQVALLVYKMTGIGAPPTADSTETKRRGLRRRKRSV